MQLPVFQPDATQTLLRLWKPTLTDPHLRFETARQVAADLLGVTPQPDGTVRVGWWLPGLADAQAAQQAQAQMVFWLPQGPLSLEQRAKGEAWTQTFTRCALPVVLCGDYVLGVYTGLPIGQRGRDGALYALEISWPDGGRQVFRDPLLVSCPFGLYAPAEVYDLAGVLRQRRDEAYFKTWKKTEFPDKSLRARDIGATLEIHPETATAAGTLAAMTAHYQALAEKIRAAQVSGQADVYAGLTPEERNWVAFDTIELTPEVPPVERERPEAEWVTLLAEPAAYGSEFFQPVPNPDATDSAGVSSSPSTLVPEQTVQVLLKKPDISNWGYDTPIIGTAAVNPSILASGRPHELLDFIETLHTFPGRPIQISLDAVLGHADFQGALLLRTLDNVWPESGAGQPRRIKYCPSRYFRGANMYGRDIHYACPMVRAILLEMLRRKINYGFDCMRVDGGQDFVKTVDEVTGCRSQDDDFINAMVNTRQTLLFSDGTRLERRLDVNVEDGRPWPNDLNWLYNATYMEHLLERRLPDDDRVKQWGSLIFAHNVHGKFKWFMTKWDRFKDTFKEGERWITGHANHDNARYYYRLVKPNPGWAYQPGDVLENFYNASYGDTLPEVTHRALDNPALSALVLGFLPGSPMFFLNTLCHKPWLFFRDIDYQYGVKVVADEASRFFTWYVSPESYAQPEAFPRLKALGFAQFSQLCQPVPDTERTAERLGFFDQLFLLHERIKTDPRVVLALFDDPPTANRQGEGLFDTVDTLEAAYASAQWDPAVARRLAQDPPESARLVEFARRLVGKELAQLTPRILADHENQRVQKLRWLQTRAEKAVAEGQTPGSAAFQSFAQLLQWSALQEGYDLETWGRHPDLVRLAPKGLLAADGALQPETLREVALAFMRDAKDLTNVSQPGADDALSRYNLALRLLRQQYPWLAQNPSNDIERDFFGRKIVANGAKDLGAFFSDQGDQIHANTFYYGWRTSPDNGTRLFFLGNMEGEPLTQLETLAWMPSTWQGLPWRVAACSPGLATQHGVALGDAPPKVIQPFRNTEALVLVA
jgi:hypothetical protein